MECSQMKFIIINPGSQSVTAINVAGFNAALICAGLRRGELDFSTVELLPDRTSISIVVYEFGLLTYSRKSSEQIKPLPMFGYQRRLYAGNALLFAADQGGNTCDITLDPVALLRAVIWLPNVYEVEKAINTNLVDRPVIAINGKV